jgi:hypothetical protein
MRHVVLDSHPSSRLIGPLLVLTVLLGASPADARHHSRRSYDHVQYLPVWPPCPLMMIRPLDQL